MNFHLILQEIMNEMNLKIPDVARKCGLPDGTVRSAISRKQENVSLDVAFKLSDGLGVSLERLNGMPEKKGKSMQKTSSLSDEALKLVQDYDVLDDYGKKLVRIVVIEEKSRCEEQAEASPTITLHTAAKTGTRSEGEIDTGFKVSTGSQLQEMQDQDKERIGGTPPAPEEK